MAYNRKYYLKHKERYRTDPEYREKVRKQRKEYYDRKKHDPEFRRKYEYIKRRKAIDPEFAEKIRKRSREYQRDNRERLKKTRAEWYKKNIQPKKHMLVSIDSCNKKIVRLEATIEHLMNCPVPSNRNARYYHEKKIDSTKKSLITLVHKRNSLEQTFKQTFIDPKEPKYPAPKGSTTPRKPVWSVKCPMCWVEFPNTVSLQCHLIGDHKIPSTEIKWRNLESTLDYVSRPVKEPLKHWDAMLHRTLFGYNYYNRRL